MLIILHSVVTKLTSFPNDSRRKMLCMLNMHKNIDINQINLKPRKNKSINYIAMLTIFEESEDCDFSVISEILRSNNIIAKITKDRLLN